MDIGIYLHIPFCLRKCHYCDFTSYPLGLGLVDDFLEALSLEMKIYSNKLSKKSLKVKTLYFGGGTPTLLSPSELERLFKTCHRYFPWEGDPEITVEANPETLNEEKLAVLKNWGVNRLSIGVQSFNPEELKKMGRLHGVSEIIEAVALIRKGGFKNISLDLIYGLPGQTLTQWRETLKKTFNLNPKHLSAYGLKIEKGTLWGKLEEKGQLEVTTEDLAREMYDELQVEAQKHDYHQYEISNFSKEGFEGKHNSRYWLMKPYLGFGPAAASFLNGERWTNHQSLRKYFQLLKSEKLPIKSRTLVDRDSEMAETIFLGLRLLKGVSLSKFKNKFSIELVDVFSKEIAYLKEKELIIIDDGYLRLTQKAIPIANHVFMEFI